MSLETDLLIDRRRLKRRLSFWRVLAVGSVALAVGAVAVRLGATGAGGGLAPHVARINVHGIITEDRKLLDAVDRLERDGTVRAAIVDIDSPGGSVAGGESLRAALIRLAAKKPVVAVMTGTAASAGYMVALPAARIFARDATLTGSIGVILETAEVSGLLGRVGVTAEAITSGPLKDQPSFTRPLTPQGREYLQGLVADMYDQFVTMVADARHMDKDRVKQLADGRAYTGRQAQALGLVDQIGGERDAMTWLKDNRGVPDSTPVRDLRIDRGWRQSLGATLGGWLGDVRTGLGIPAPGAWAIWRGGAAE